MQKTCMWSCAAYCAPYSFARCHIGEAMSLLLQNTVLEGQQSLLRLCFAKDRHPDRPAHVPSGPAADALQVTEFMTP